jgi:hypothetical protein
MYTKVGMLFVHIVEFIMNTFHLIFAVQWLTLLFHVLDVSLNINWEVIPL